MKINSRTLAAIITKLRKALDSRATEIQRGILITPDGMEAASMEVGAVYRMDTGVEGPFILPGNALDLIPKLPDADVEITNKGNKVEVRCKSVKNLFATPPAGEYLRPQIDKGEAEARLDMEALLEGIDRILYAVATVEARPILTGIHFRAMDGRLRLEALDGFRMATANTDARWEQSAVIQAAAIRKLIAFGLEGEAEIKADGAFVVFDAGEYAFACRKLSGDYPDTSQLLPDNKHAVKVNREELLAAVERCSIAVRDGSKPASPTPVNLQIKDSYILISSASSMGNHVESVEAEADKPMDIAFSPTYLMDCLKHIHQEEVVLRYNSEVSPVCVTQEDGVSLVLPVRLRVS